MKVLVVAKVVMVADPNRLLNVGIAINKRYGKDFDIALFNGLGKEELDRMSRMGVKHWHDLGLELLADKDLDLVVFMDHEVIDYYFAAIKRICPSVMTAAFLDKKPDDLGVLEALDMVWVAKDELAKAITDELPSISSRLTCYPVRS